MLADLLYSLREIEFIFNLFGYISFRSGLALVSSFLIVILLMPYWIRVQLRKKNETTDETKNIISHGKLKLDPSQLECEWNGKSLPDKLTTTEFLIVKELAKRPGVIKERSHLMDIAYKENTEIEDRTIDSHVKRIRKKFKKVDDKFSAIETRYGSGYRWNVS